MKKIYFTLFGYLLIALFAQCSDSEDAGPQIADDFENENPMFSLSDQSAYDINGDPAKYDTKNGLGYAFNTNSGITYCSDTTDFLKLNTIEGVWAEGFTVTAKVQFEENRNYERIIDLGNGKGIEFGYNITLARLEETNDLALSSWINEFNSDVQGVVAHDAIQNGKMTFYAATIAPDGTMDIYVNDQLVVSEKRQPLVNTRRTSNYIGRSNWCERDPDFKGRIENLHIYNRALNEAEIKYLYNEQSS